MKGTLFSMRLSALPFSRLHTCAQRPAQQVFAAQGEPGELCDPQGDMAPGICLLWCVLSVQLFPSPTDAITGLLTRGPVPTQKRRHTETKQPGPRQKFKILIFFFHGFLTFPYGFLIFSFGYVLALLERHGSILMTLSIKRSFVLGQSDWEFCADFSLLLNISP